METKDSKPEVKTKTRTKWRNRLQKIDAVLVGEVVKYEELNRLCYIRTPERILIGLAEQLTENRNPL